MLEDDFSDFLLCRQQQKDVCGPQIEDCQQRPVSCQCLLKMGHPRPLFRLLTVFQTNTTFFTTKDEKYPSGIRCWDSNARPSERESPQITTSPGLPLVANVKVLFGGRCGSPKNVYSGRKACLLLAEIMSHKHCWPQIKATRMSMVF